MDIKEQPYIDPRSKSVNTKFPITTKSQLNDSFVKIQSRQMPSIQKYPQQKKRFGGRSKYEDMALESEMTVDSYYKNIIM